MEEIISNNPEPKKEVKRIHLLRLSLRKPLPNDDYAVLGWAVREGYPRIQVFTSKNIKKEDGSTDYDKIVIAPFTYPILFTFIDSLEKLVTENSDRVSQITCYNNKFVDNKRTDEIEEQATVRFVRSQEGVINIGIKVKDKYMYFPLFPDTKWHKFYNKDGEEITDKKTLSNLFATAYVSLLKGTFINTTLE